MNNNPLEILNAAKKQRENNNTKIPKQNKQNTQSWVSNDFNYLEKLYVDGNITNENISPNNQQHKIYDAQEEMKQIQEGEKFNTQNSKLPAAILESLLKNPLTMPTNVESNNLINTETQNKSMEIIRLLEERDNKKQPPNRSQETQQIQYHNNIDDNITNIIEEIIDRKLKEYCSIIFEYIKNNTPTTIKYLKLDDTLTFIDDSDKVFDCKLTYKGKAKTKRG